MYQKQSVILTPAQFKKLAFQAFERDCFRCQICGMGTLEELVPHHIIPRGRIHLDVLNNILTACTCHIPLHNGELDVSIDDIIDQYRYRLKEYLP